MGSLSSEGLVTSGEQYRRTCQRPNTERGYQPSVEGGVPPMGGGTNPEGKLGQGAREAWTGSTGSLDLCLHKAKKQLGATLHQARTQVPSPALSTLSFTLNNSP